MQEKVTHCYQLIDFHLLVNDLSYIYDDYGSHLFVSFISIQEPLIKVLMDWSDVSDINFGGPFSMFDNSVVALLVVPVATLQEP